jgi:hypothetical protein
MTNEVFPFPRMDRRITITYQPKVYRALLLRTWSRHTTLPWRVAYFVISELPIVLGIYSGNTSTLYWAVAGGLAVSGFWPLLLFWRQMRAYKLIFGNSPGYVVNVTDESLKLDTGSTRFELPWFSLTDIVKFDQAWALQFVGKGHVIISSGSLDDELKQFLTAKLNAALSSDKPRSTETFKEKKVDY